MRIGSASSPGSGASATSARARVSPKAIISRSVRVLQERPVSAK